MHGCCCCCCSYSCTLTHPTHRHTCTPTQVAHIMNNEMQRKYLTSIKRLMRFAQVRTCPSFSRCRWHGVFYAWSKDGGNSPDIPSHEPTHTQIQTGQAPRCAAQQEVLLRGSGRVERRKAERFCAQKNKKKGIDTWLMCVPLSLLFVLHLFLPWTLGLLDTLSRQHVVGLVTHQRLVVH